MENTGVLARILLLAAGGVLLFAGARLVQFAFRLWRLGLNARALLATLLGALYTLSPVDGIPDVIFGIGWLDDMVVLGMVALYVYRTLSGRRVRRAPAVTVVPQIGPR